jgi:threonine/homoserine/homoserine lactone efflux protein
VAKNPNVISFKYAFGSQQVPGGIPAWINFEVIRLITHHTSTVVAAVVLFWFVGWLVRRMLDDGIMKRAVLFLDELVLLCIFAYFAYELLFVLYLRTRDLWPS